MMMPLLNYGGINWSLIAKVVMSVLFLTLIISYLVKYPQLPKMTAYQGVKAAVKLKLNYQAKEWHQQESDNIVVFYNKADESAMPVVLAVGEEAYGQVNQALNFIPTKKIPIMIYSNRTSLNKSFGWEADVSAMGAYWAGIIKVLSPFAWIDTDDQQELEEEFRFTGPVVHEYVHLVVDEKTRGNYSRWFTEGLAQYWEREFTGFQFDSPNGTLDQELYPIQKMDMQFDSLPNQALAYSQSLAMVDYFYEKYGAQKMEQLLLELGKGFSMDQVLINTIGVDLSGFISDFKQWLEEHNYLVEAKAKIATSHQRLQVS